MNTLKKLKNRLRSYYYYVCIVLERLQYDLPNQVLSVQRAKTVLDQAYALGELAAYHVIIEKIFVYAHYFSVPMALDPKEKRTDFECCYSNILDHPKNLKSALCTYQSYVRALSNHLEEIHKHLSLECRKAKTGQYRSFSAGQEIAYYVVRSRLKSQAQVFLMPLREIGMEDPIPIQYY